MLRRRNQPFLCSSAEDDVLSSVDLINSGHSFERRAHLGFPEQLPGFYIEGPDLLIAGSGKQQSPSRDYRADLGVMSPGPFNSGNVPQDDLPLDSPHVQVV